MSRNKNLNRSQTAISNEYRFKRQRLLVSIAVVFGLWIFASCQFSGISGDDFSEVLQANETAVHSVLEIGGNGETVAEGDVTSVSGLGSDCSVDEGQCYFSMDVEGVIVFIHYLFDPDRPQCLNSAASEQALKIQVGDHVKVFGQYFGAGNISVCGNLDYYIEVIPPGG